MSETHSMVRVRRIDYICDHCGEGRMIDTGAWWQIHSTSMKVHCHRCEVCGVQATFYTTYPRTEYIQEASQ